MTKTRQDNDMIDSIGAIYVENEIELSWLIRPGIVYEVTKQNNDVTKHTCVIYAENDIELLWSIGLGFVCDENQIGQLHD